MARELTNRQKRFIQEYRIDSNATQAAIRAGYEKKSARVSGHNCITNYNIKQAIAKERQVFAEKTGITVAYIQSEHQRLAALAEAKGDVGVATRNKELLGKTIGAYMEKQVIIDDIEVMTDAEEAEARRIAGLLMDKGLGLRAG